MLKNHFQLSKETILAVILGMVMLFGVVVNGIVLVDGFVSVYVAKSDNNASGGLDSATIEAAIEEVLR